MNRLINVLFDIARVGEETPNRVDGVEETYVKAISTLVLSRMGFGHWLHEHLDRIVYACMGWTKRKTISVNVFSMLYRESSFLC